MRLFYPSLTLLVTILLIASGFVTRPDEPEVVSGSWPGLVIRVFANGQALPAYQRHIGRESANLDKAEPAPGPAIPADGQAGTGSPEADLFSDQAGRCRLGRRTGHPDPGTA